MKRQENTVLKKKKKKFPPEYFLENRNRYRRILYNVVYLYICVVCVFLYRDRDKSVAEKAVIVLKTDAAAFGQDQMERNKH